MISVLPIKCLASLTRGKAYPTAKVVHCCAQRVATLQCEEHVPVVRHDNEGVQINDSTYTKLHKTLATVGFLIVRQLACQ